MTQARAKIAWVRTRPNARVAAPVRFNGDNSWPEEAWSLVVEQSSGEDIHEVRFLVPEAPHHLLKQGARFTLLDGEKAIATGIVI